MKRWQSFTRLTLALAIVVTGITGWRRASSAGQTIEQPLALAAGDFDEDGAPDLLSGYASGGVGVIKRRRGEITAVYPGLRVTQPAERETAYEPFHAAESATPLPVAPDFLGAGDFDADGHLDALVADRGGERLYWLSGDGRGGFGAAQAFAIPGQVTALLTGEINRADGLADVIVGVTGVNGPQLLIFEGAEGALRRAPEIYDLRSAARGFALGQFDDDGMIDLAIAAGERMLIVHGRDRRLSLDLGQQAAVAPAQVDERVFPAFVIALASGYFAGGPQIDLALLTADGAVQVLDNQSATSTVAGAGVGRGRAKPIEQWTAKEIFRLSNTPPLQPGHNQAPLLFMARLSSSPHDQLILADDASRRLLILNDAGDDDGRLAVKYSPAAGGAAAIELSGAPRAILPCLSLPPKPIRAPLRSTPEISIATANLTRL